MSYRFPVSFFQVLMFLQASKAGMPVSNFAQCNVSAICVSLLIQVNPSIQLI